MGKNEQQFSTLYRALNAAQRAAVDAIQGPVMIIADPGTGKTQVLTLRIANILRQTDTPPEAILALAFTRSAAATLRQRLVSIIGTAGFRVKIHTFHSFCNEIIRTYPEYFPRIIGSTAALPIDQIRLMRQVIDETPLKLLKPFGSPYYYLYPALESIDRLKKENVSPAGLAKWLRGAKSADRSFERTKELLKLYRSYEAALAKAKLYDFNDMVMEVIRRLEGDAGFRELLQAEHQYLLADEHQDANQSQNELLRLLTNFDDSPNLFIVGDAKQAIFQFQGASLDNFNYFRRLYPTAVVIALVENYRSHQLILDAAHSLLSDGAALRAPRRKAGPKIVCRRFASEAAELAWLAAELKGKSNVAVIYRDNRDAEDLIELLERAGVPFNVQSDANLLRDIDIRKLLILLQTIHHFGDDHWLKLCLHLDFLKLPPLDVWRLTTARRRESLYHTLGSRDKLGQLGLARADKFHNFYLKLERWKRLATNANFTDLFGLVLEESQLLPYLLKKRSAVDKLEKLRAFFDELKNILKANPDFSLADFIGYLAILEEHHVSLNAKQTIGRGGVTLLTAHKAKGLEFDQVYIIRVTDNRFGARRTSELFHLPNRGEVVSSEAVAAERRLLYVALTRGREAVHLSYATTDGEGNHRLPSRFLEEIDKTKLELIDVADALPKAKPDNPFKPRTYQGAKITDRAFLNQLFSERGLSVTGLNNYLACPLRYFFNNLLRVTKVQRRELLYGVAVHAALKNFFDRYREGEPVSAPLLIQNFKRALAREPLSPLDRPAVVAKGERALTGYF
ncbi:MAG: ATP-dependent DNA helicase, partial [Patescibacteria group bacterium]